MRTHKCQWCGHWLQERYMRQWNDKWQCKATWPCVARYRKRWKR